MILSLETVLEETCCEDLRAQGTFFVCVCGPSGTPGVTITFGVKQKALGTHRHAPGKPLHKHLLIVDYTRGDKEMGTPV